MLSPLQLTSHNEKVQFLLDYLNGTLQQYPLDTPLMIHGNGGNGKSKILQEILEVSPVPILVLQSGEVYRYFPNQFPSNRIAVLLINNGASEDFEAAQYMRANIVEFLSDPSFPRLT